MPECGSREVSIDDDAVLDGGSDREADEALGNSRVVITIPRFLST